MVWQALRIAIEMFSNGVRLVTQALALIDVLQGHGDERLLTWMTLAAESLTLFQPNLGTRVNLGELSGMFS